MKVIGSDCLETVVRKHARAAPALRAWLKVAQTATWKNLMEVRRSINTASGGVKGSYTVFNIGGNTFRLITVINYKIQTILITDVLTHAEYDKWSRS
jgi:mRNA interferase HigB